MGTEFVSFSILTRSFTWPQPLVEPLKSAQGGGAVGPEVEKVLREHLILRQRDPDDQLFPLQQTRPDGWTNSTRGQAILERNEGPMAVLDALCWSDLAKLPSHGAFLYLGDGHGGFYASETRSADGKIPCARCLTLRYLSGRKALPKLRLALDSGARVAFAQPEQENDALEQSGLTLFGSSSEAVDEVLPLADCALCLERSQVRSLEVHLMSPVTSQISLGENHAAHLPQMLWLTGQDTVGSGGAFDADPARGRERALNEALERYAAHFPPTAVPSQGVPFQAWRGEHPDRHFSLKATYLTEPGSLSTGLACRHSLGNAIEDGLREVCERDALARFWLQAEKGEARALPLGEQRVEDLMIRHYQLDSYHLPTVLCLAWTAQGNLASGSACGPLEQARAKAESECLQNVAYLRTYAPERPVEAPESFLHHAALYWHGHREFPEIAEAPSMTVRPVPAPVYYRELTPPDLALTGRHAVRVQVPGMLVVPMSHADWSTLLEEAGHDAEPPATPHPFN